MSKYYQLSGIQSGKDPISSNTKVIYSKDNLYWAFVQYDPSSDDDDQIHLDNGKITLLKADAASDPNVRRIDLKLRPQLDKKRHTVSLGDLWNLQHLKGIYQRDTTNIYSPISVITQHTPTN
nr:MAG TPA: hypothetical protein [Caudoviricetes sp.]